MLIRWETGRPEPGRRFCGALPPCTQMARTESGCRPSGRRLRLETHHELGKTKAHRRHTEADRHAASERSTSVYRGEKKEQEE